jgi:hydroxyacylglutathione hydrolase
MLLVFFAFIDFYAHMKVQQIPVLLDNYAYVAQCTKTGQVALIDTPDAAAIQNYLKTQGLQANAIFNTHHHWDHAGGNEDIVNAYSCDVTCSHHDKSRIDRVTHTVGEGDNAKLGELSFKVLDVPGHTLGHIAYYGHGVLFCGDTLFVGGCGRLFEGTPEQMHASLQKIAALPGDTKIYCAHEYTENNLQFALTVEPGNLALQGKIKAVKELRSQNLPTVPSTLAEELSYNPFLRCDSEEIVKSLQSKGYKGVEDAVNVFAALRELKDKL